MNTTVTLDDNIASRLQAESRRTGRPFETIVNEYLRVALAQRKALQLGGFADERPVEGAQQEG
ncbi:MAG: hypothetical protein ACRESY_11645 [Steroidobacteraceae bacterium]